MAKIRIEELDQLAGEVLPERTVLSAVPSDPSGAAPFSPFCSPNAPNNSVSGSVAGFAIANQQCGLENSNHGTGIGEVEL